MKTISIGSYLLFTALFLVAIACSNHTEVSDSMVEKSAPAQSTSEEESRTNSIGESMTAENAQTQPKFELPDDYIPFDTIRGDLNGDQIDDYVLIVKATQKEKVVVNRFDKTVDRNRRGIMVFLSDNKQIKLNKKNLNCFSSENEDGGVYFPPELYIEIENGKLFVHYAHGRYGYWKYTFRYQEDAFKLIGYDQSENMGPIVHYFNSYNFLTNKKLTKENINFYSETPDDEVFKETWEDLPKSKLKTLESITDFDELHFD